MTSTLTTRKAATILASLALVGASASPAMAVPDYGTPDARDAMVASQTSSSSSPLQREFGSPDALDNASGYRPQVSEASTVSGDFRSPDARDVATGYAPTAPVSTSVDSPSSGGFDWLSALIGIAAAGGIVLLLMALVTHRRHTHTPGAHPA